MAIFKSGLTVSVMVIFVFLTNLFLKEFKLGWVDSWVADHISEDGDTFSGILSVDLKVESCEFSIGMSGIFSTHVSEFFVEIVFRSAV